MLRLMHSRRYALIEISPEGPSFRDWGDCQHALSPQRSRPKSMATSRIRSGCGAWIVMAASALGALAVGQALEPLGQPLGAQKLPPCRSIPGAAREQAGDGACDTASQIDDHQHEQDAKRQLPVARHHRAQVVGKGSDEDTAEQCAEQRGATAEATQTTTSVERAHPRAMAPRSWRGCSRFSFGRASKGVRIGSLRRTSPV